MIYAFFPIIAAMFYGLAFAATEKALSYTSITTIMILGSAFGICVVSGLMFIKNEPPSFSFLNDKTGTALVATAVIAPAFGWLLTNYAIKNINSSYAAFAEVSYPLFTILFLFLLFGIRHFDWHVIVGGIMVIAGSVVLVLGQLRN